MREPRNVLVVDDNAAMRDSLTRTLAREAITVFAAGDTPAALDALRQHPVDVVVTDLRMPGLSGLDLLRAVKSIRADVEVILITAHGNVDDAVKAMKDGAYDFITKPFTPLAIRKAVDKALEKRALQAANRALAQELERLQARGETIAASPAMRQVLAVVEQVAPTNATVLIQGETGTGKERIAEAIHRMSERRGKSLVKLNCAALPETLLESELFGYEKGAFTGAAGRKEGRFELADGGTLFMDEVGDLSSATQAKLLRVLQEGEFERVGGTRTLKVDVRLVTATNKDLAAGVREKAFREDLYYRLNVVVLRLPPLREREEDIPLLAHHFLERYAARNNKRLDGFAPIAMERFLAYSWPGNVRELEHAVEHAVIFSRGTLVGLNDLPEVIAGAETEAPRSLTVPLGTSMEEVERRLIEETLRRTKGDKKLAAALLGISPRTIYRKLGESVGPEDGGASSGPEDTAERN
jgi:two-component system, NtrC family, response regulator HydG